jgi:hypothetical protein
LIPQFTLRTDEKWWQENCVATLKRQQRAEGRVGWIGDWLEDHDQGNHCHVGEQEQQCGWTVTGRRCDYHCYHCRLLVQLIPWGGSSWLTTLLDRCYGKCRLDSALNGRTLLTIIPSTEASGPGGTP